ncbi:MAG: right-handed parallel beta-helix repeat-containing protein, partial [Candidatus Thermoplasmatota archaeon]|nr:right-handed parallel beta-helix repeat-containing protein [Candidatus Thermoplasmatota archaeon]
MKSRMLSFITLLMFLGMVFVITAPTSAVPTRTTLPFVITTDTVFPKDDYDMTYHFTIESGARVTFEAGSTITVSSSGIYVIDVRGDLYFEGTQSEPITITTGAASPVPGDWGGIQYQTESSGAVNYTDIRYAMNGLYIYFRSSVSVSHSLFNNCSQAGILYSNFMGAVPDNMVVEYTDFTENNVGIRENGRGTLIDHCTFSDSTYYGIEMGQGSWPMSDGCRIVDSTFKDNGYEDIFLNTTDDSLRISNVTIDGCKFKRQAGYNTYHPFVFSPDTISYLNITSNSFYRSNRERGIILRSSLKVNFSLNGIYSFDGEYYSERMLECHDFNDLVIWGNHFRGSYPYRGYTQTIIAEDGEGVEVRDNIISNGCYNGIRIRNSTDVLVIGNLVQDSHSGIGIGTSSDVGVSKNIVSKETWENMGTGIYVYDAVFKVFETQTVISNNTVLGFSQGISVDTNGENILSGNRVVDCGGGYYIVGDSRWVNDPLYHETVLIENCTSENSGSLDVNGYRTNVTVRAVNCSMNMSRISMEVVGPVHHGDLFWSSYIRGAVSNELGERETFEIDVRDGDSSLWHSGTYDGVSPLIEGPPLHYFYNWTDGMYIVDPHSAWVNYTLRTDSGSHRGSVNLTSYTLVDAMLDHEPVFTPPSPIHFDEDTWLSLNMSLIFSDLDDILSYEVISEDNNLTSTVSEVTNTFVNWTGEGNVVYRATDTLGNFTDGMVTFIVDPVQDSPEIKGLPENFTLDEDTTTWLNLSMFMFDADGDPLSWNFTSNENLSCVMDSSSWNLTISPPENWNGGSAVRLFLNDTFHEVNTTLPVYVKPVNDPPVFHVPADWNITVKRGELIKFNISDIVSDIDDTELFFSTDSEYISIQNCELMVLFPEGTNHTISNVNIRVEDPWGGFDISTLMIYITGGGSGGEKANWTLITSSANMGGSSNWNVTCRGLPGQSVFIIIEGIGSFPLSEDMSNPGNYSVTIGSENFQ